MALAGSPTLEQCLAGSLVAHTPQLRGVLQRVFPERYNEVVGVNHTKIYLFDDTLILSRHGIIVIGNSNCNSKDYRSQCNSNSNISIYKWKKGSNSNSNLLCNKPERCRLTFLGQNAVDLLVNIIFEKLMNIKCDSHLLNKY